MSDLSNKSDRDLLVEIHTNVDSLIQRDEDKEKRLRALEKNRWITYGALTVVIFFREQLAKFFRG